METASIENSEPGDGAITQRFIATSLGEHLIPFLVLGGEVCIGYVVLLGLAVSVHFAGDANPLLPVRGLLLVMLSFYTTSRLFQRRSPTGLARKVIEPLTWLPLVLCFTFFFVWLNNYAQTTSLFSPNWLLALAHNFIPVTPAADEPPGAWAEIHVDITPAIQTAVLILLIGLAGWRGYRLANKHLISADIDRLFKWGSSLIVIVIGIFLIQFYAGVTRLSPQIPALLAATFFICALTARALQNASYMRNFHRAKLWGSAAKQEQIIWFMMLLLGLVAILLAFFFGNATTGQKTPLERKTGGKIGPGKLPDWPSSAHATPLSLWPIIILLLLILGVIAFLLWRRSQKLHSFKRLKAKQANEGSSDETHETIFNWSLFLSQLRATLLALLTRFNPFHKRKGSLGAEVIDDIRLAEPTVRSIREVYRALLKNAASRGQARAQNETPYELWQRLKQQEALAGPEVETITEAYVLARYSGHRPAESEVSRVKQLWGQLKERWV